MAERAAPERRPPKRRRTPASLTGRIVLVTFAVALIAVLVTAVVSVGVVQSVAEGQARQQLRAQATALVADAATSATRLDRLTQRLTVLGDRFAVVAPDGTVSGPARASVDDVVVRELQDGRAVSTTTTIGGRDAVLVGIPGPAGGGVVGVRKVADIAAGTAELLRWIAVALVVGLVVATAAGWLLARLLGRPMTRLAAGARELAQGRRRVAIADQPVAEIEDVAAALRTLDEALSASEDRQREFLLSVSHEIRTPLTAIRGYAEALADGMVPAAETARIGATLTTESERLRRFVDDLLELARLEADDFAIDPQRFDARGTVQRTVEAWAAACARVGVALRAELPADELPIVTDEMRLRQIVDGLVENALRVTPAGAPIVIAARTTDDGADPGGVQLEVRDGGPGLDEADGAVAFERGELRDRYRDLRPVGTGLGLSIARRLVGRLGGAISVRRAPEGGAAFVVGLPPAAPLRSSNTPLARR
ncbi:HAMP domain-containing histidine kinase [Leifsonia sp. ZF2019]|uniref:sensor histidine kinase n=1 Tax=Leifsonia sp. ZF2019 TaxID=2781978 RepID=UPI001CBC6209|nr:HAMP domain-containing sensor histidine kinase [Leifsonia sp. ZF2019]UAJ80752.1 HAMP domain-containing histidine kinase [Leifsonia sp. ZF2019]